MKPLCIFFTLFMIAAAASAAEYHVATTGNDRNPGSASQPLRTIQAAADLAQPGDTITVHEGTYRERITPPRGGESDTKRIVYQAATGEKVEVKGSEVVTGWKPLADGVWKVTLPNSFFGDYNPFKELLTGDWLSKKGREHHTGDVYLNGKSLYEMEALDKVLKPAVYADSRDPEGSTYTWYCETDDKQTTIWANFHDYDPNKELVEVNARESCVYPDQPGRNFITIRGFLMSQTATQWAAPTAEQIGLIGINWSKGWIIEDNVISNSKCTGITLGKDRKSGHNVWSNDPSKGGADHYNEVIVRVLKDGWGKPKIGSHIVRNNTIFACEQAGICGSMGSAFSLVENNHIYDIWTKRLYAGAEIGGIKFHGAIDTLIRNNHIHNVGRGMWMDWMTQGTRLTRNLCYDNTTDDFFSEVNHGPYLVDNNIFLSEIAIRNWSEGGAFVHNLIAGQIVLSTPTRTTPYHPAHSTQVAALKAITGGDDRFYNNIFVGRNASGPDSLRAQQKRSYGLNVFDDAKLPIWAKGNVHLNGAKPHAKESGSVEAAFDPKLKIVNDGDRATLHMTLPSNWKDAETQVVTTDLLGTAAIPGVPYENADGSPVTVDTDFFGEKRSETPSPGPFETPGDGQLTLEVGHR